MTYTAL